MPRSNERQNDDDQRDMANRERDDEGRFTRSRDDDNDDHDRRGGSRSQSAQSRPRDDEGRFTSDAPRGRSQDDEDAEYSDWHAYGHARGWHNHQRRAAQARSQRAQSARQDDRGYAQERGQGGWFGDPEGHSEASQRGWDERRSDDDDDRRNGSRVSGRSSDNRH